MSAQKSARYEAITFILKKMQFLRINPYKPNKLKIYGILFLVYILHFVQYYYALALIANPKTGFVVKASGLKTISANSQSIKLFAVLRFDDLLYLIGNLDRFWESESVEKWYKYGLRGAKGFQHCLYIAFTIIFIIPLFFGYIPFDGDYPVFSFSAYIFGTIQCIQFIYDLNAIIITDGLFICMSFFVYAQFLLLNERLRRLGECPDSAKVYQEARICVQHQKFLYEYVDRYGKMFTAPLLVQYFLTTSAICVEMFVFARQDFRGMFLSVTYLTALLFQLAMYCFPADIIIQEGMETSQAVVSSKWYEHPSVSKTFVEHIIRRSQKELKFKAGGFFEINKVALTLIFKWCFSLYAMMRDMARLID